MIYKGKLHILNHDDIEVTVRDTIKKGDQEYTSETNIIEKLRELDGKQVIINIQEDKPKKVVVNIHEDKPRIK